jgi:Holliday junction resolvase RusA-like endonuclease
MNPSFQVAFTVYAKPQPQGSARAFRPKGWSRPVITTDNPKLKPYRQEVALTAMAAMESAAPVFRDLPVELTTRFYFERPKSLPKRILHKTQKPDGLKCARAVEDALKGIVYADDAQIVRHVIEKHFGAPERTEITVRILDDEVMPRLNFKEACERSQLQHA